MRKWLLTILLGTILIAGPAYAQVKAELGGTGSLANTGTNDSFLVGIAAGTGFEEEVPSGTCTSSTFLRFDATAADGSRLVCATPSGTGDITAVGPMYASGDAFVDGITTTGTEFLVIEGVTSNTSEYHFAVPAADPGSDITYTFPSTSGTLVHSTDNIATATALAANPAACGTGQVVTDIAADGTLTCGNIETLVVVDEDAGGTLLYDGADKVYNLANTPGSCDAVEITFNGYAMKKVVTASANNEFSCATATITFFLAPASGDHVQASYTL